MAYQSRHNSRSGDHYDGHDGRRLEARTFHGDVSELKAYAQKFSRMAHLPASPHIQPESIATVSTLLTCPGASRLVR